MISYQFHITLEKTVKPIKWGKTGKLVASNILQNSSHLENLGNWYPYFSHSMDVFSIRFPFSGILHRVGNASVFSTNFPEHQKIQQNPSNGEDLRNWFPYFFDKMSGFFHYISILWYTSSYGKSMGFLINFLKHGKRQENPSNGVKHGKLVPRKILQNPAYVENLGNQYLYFSHSIGDFFPLDSHPIVCFIICEIHGFPHQFPIAWKNAAKSIEFPGKLVPIFSPLYEYFCSIRFSSNLILYHMGNAWLCLSISNSTGKYSKIPL